MTFSINPFQFYVCFKGMYIQQLEIRSILSPEILFSFFSFQKKESSFKAREPLVSVDGLEAGLKHGGQQASAEERIFKTCALQGFGNISFSVWALSQLFFRFCSRPAQHNGLYQELTLKTPFGSVKQCHGRVAVSQGEREGILLSTQHSSLSGHHLCE